LNPSKFGPHVLSSTTLFAGITDTGPLFIHGYNSTEIEAKSQYLEFAKHLDLDATLYIWPGGSHPAEFVLAVDRADTAGYRLRDVLTMSRTHEIVVTHSLGARVALTALKHGGMAVKTLILLGAAVDYDAISPTGEFRTALEECEQIHVISSVNDPVLKVFFPLGDVHGDHRALGCWGPSCSLPGNVATHDMSSVVHAHGDYLIKPECIALVSKLIQP
jgi:hypothetical protein